VLPTCRPGFLRDPGHRLLLIPARALQEYVFRDVMPYNLVPVYHTIPCHIPEDINLNIVAYRPVASDNRETHNETTAIAMQRFRKYATVLYALLRSGPRATMEVLLEAVFSMWSAPRLYKLDRPSSVSAVEWSELVGE
jgi:hypothetical protein